MDLNLTPDTYTPSVDNNGNYIDNILLLKMDYYVCGSRKDKIYETISKFNSHTKTKKHKNGYQ